MNEVKKGAAGKNRPQRRNDGAGRQGEAQQPFKPGLAARMTATKLMTAVVDRKTSLDGMLDAEHGNPSYTALSDADRALVRAILNSALRHLTRIETILSELLDSPLPDGARSLHHLLVIAAAQMLYLDIPDHSAVDLAVEQANRDPRSRRFAKLVNAILRRIGREREPLLEWVDTISPVPEWFDARLAAVYGKPAAESIGRALLTPAAIDITVKSDPAGWAERLNGVVLPTGGVRLKDFKGAVSALEGFEDGEWWVQDAAAAIPARLFGDLTGKTAVDLCAAPGGKTAQLILQGADVTAVEQSANRLARLEGNLARLKLSARSVRANLKDFKPDQLFDAILLDAPCSSTGTTRRHPDVLWTKGPEDIAKLAGVQEDLLRHAVTLLAPGGKLVFSNCSLDPSEGEDVVAAVLADNPQLARVAVKADELPGLEEAITPLGEIRTTPAMLHQLEGVSGGLDGFYACVICRI